MKSQLLLLGLMALVAVQAVAENDAAAEAAAELADEQWHDADTPTRQAQRSMLAERETATAKHATDDVLGMRLQAVYPDKAFAEARRISGAAQSFHPDDRMCVMCQFLSQRIQLDLVGGVGGVGASFGGFGMPPYAMISGVAPVAGGAAAAASFLESGDSASDEELVEIDIEAADEDQDEEEADEEIEAEDAAFLQVAEEEEEEESEDEEEADESDEEADESEDEEEADEESEDESEEQEEAEEALIEVSGAEADETEWMTPEFAAASAAPVPTVSLIEEEADDFQTPQYIDGVYHTVEGEETATAEQSAEVDAGTADMAEAAFFESAALTSKAADEGEWTTPEFVAEPAAAKVESVPAELTAFLQTAEEGDSEDGWTTPTYTDAAAASASAGNKQYARVIVPHEKEQSLIEAAAEQTTVSNAAAAASASAEVKVFTPRYITSRSSNWATPKLYNRYRTQGPDIFHTPKRYRSADAIVPRPRWDRFAPHSPRHTANRLIAGMALRSAEHNAYDHLEAYCSTRLPESYGKYCRPVLRKFRRITEGLSYGDRIPHVCMAVNLCKKSSYVVASVHDRLEERTF